MNQEFTSGTPHVRTGQSLLTGGGTVGALMRAFDWPLSPFGAVRDWPQSLRTVVRLCLTSRFPTVILWGPEFHLIYNDAYIPILGDRHPAAFGRATQDVWPETWPIISPMLRKVLETGEAVWFEDLCLPTTQERFFTFSYSPVEYETGQVCGVFCVVTETTERVKTERRVNESEARMQTALAAAQMGTWDLDLVHDRAERSARHDEIFGYDTLQAEWGEAIALRHVLPEDQEVFRESFRRAREEGELRLEVRVRWPDGSMHTVFALGRTEYNEQGDPVRMSGVVMDITARKRAEAALRESEERLQMSLQAARMATYEWSSEGDRVSMSEMAAEVLGLISGKEFSTSDEGFHLIHPEDRARHQAIFEHAANAGGDFHTEYRIIRPRDGRVAWIEERGRGSRDPVTGATRLRGVLWDISERRQAEEQLRASEKRQVFLLKLSDALRPLTDAVEIQAEAARVLGEQLQVDRALYAEVDADTETYVIHDNYVRGEYPKLLGRLAISAFGEASALLRAGGTLVVTDMRSDDDLGATARAEFLAAGVGATIAFSLVKNERWVAIFGVHSAAPRRWKPEEIAMVEGTAERTWAAVERAYAEKRLRQLHRELEQRVEDRTCALQESEERFRIMAQVTNDLLYDWDIAANAVWRSNGFQQLFGREPAGGLQAKGFQWWTHRLHPDDREQVLSQLQMVLHSNAATCYSEYRFQRLDGSYAFVMDTMYLFRDAHGKAVRGIGAITDITTRKEAEAARHVLTQQLFDLQETERRHLARELHDEVMQTLTALQINLDGLEQEQPAAAATLRASTALVEDLVDQVRTLSLELRPTVLDELGLAAALEWYCQRQAPRLGLTAHYTCDSAVSRPHPVIETTCFRVVQEAVTNVAKHAHTNAVWIDLRQDLSTVCLTISDLGTGFNVATAQQRAGREVGIGLHGMAERLRLVGGRLEIRSTPGQGTTVRVWTPYTITPSDSHTGNKEVVYATDPDPAG